MNKQEFLKIVEQIRGFFPRTNFLLIPQSSNPDNNALNNWYRALKDMDYKDMVLAVDEYVKENKFPPSVADLRECANRVKADRESLRHEINNYFNHIISGYPGEKDGKEIFDRLVFENDNTDEQIRKASWITARCLEQVDRYDRKEAEFMPLKEYLENLEREIWKQRKQS